jgi:ATP-dependent Zn protease
VYLCAGADLENMVNWAAIEATKSKMKKITQKLLEDALLNVAMGKNKAHSMLINKQCSNI